MFPNNKYTKLYYKLISSPDTEGYTENHHIIPRCLGGCDSPSNIVSISARKHFICHWLLLKMAPNPSPEFYRLIRAFVMMANCSSSNQERRYNSRIYQYYREEFSKLQSNSQSGPNNSQFGTCWIYCPYTLRSKKVPKNDLQKYLDNGCLKGRIMDPNNPPKYTSKAIIYPKEIKASVPLKDRVYIHCPYSLTTYSIQKEYLQSYLNKGCIKGKAPNLIRIKESIRMSKLVHNSGLSLREYTKQNCSYSHVALYKLINYYNH